MNGAHGGPRLLLRRLREVMAEPVSAQARLDRIVVAHRRQHGRRGLLGLRAARRQPARTLRNRGPEPRGRPPHHHARGRGPRRPDRAISGSARARRRAAAPGLLLPAGDGRGDLFLVPRRADPARRQHARRARRAEQGATPLQRRGGGGPADHGDAARRDDRVRRAAVARRPADDLARGGRCRSTGTPDHRRHRARPRRAARAAHRHQADRRRGRDRSWSGSKWPSPPCAPRSTGSSSAATPAGRDPRHPGDLPHDRPRPGLAAPAARGRATRG